MYNTTYAHVHVYIIDNLHMHAEYSTIQTTRAIRISYIVQQHSPYILYPTHTNHCMYYTTQLPSTVQSTPLQTTWLTTLPRHLAIYLAVHLLAIGCSVLLIFDHKSY